MKIVLIKTSISIKIINQDSICKKWFDFHRIYSLLQKGYQFSSFSIKKGYLFKQIQPLQKGPFWDRSNTDEVQKSMGVHPPGVCRRNYLDLLNYANYLQIAKSIPISGYRWWANPDIRLLFQFTHIHRIYCGRLSHFGFPRLPWASGRF